MSFRGRGESANPNKMELGEPRKFGGGPDNDKSSRDENDRFDSSRGRRPPFGGRGGRPSPGRDRPPFNDRSSRDFGYSGRDDPIGRDRSPLRPPSDRFSDRYRKDDDFPKRDDHARKDSGRSYFPEDSPRDRFMDSRSRHEDRPGSFSSRYDSPSSMPYKARPMGFPAAPGKGQYYDGFPKPNECEIIVVNKLQRAYAELVEDRVKGLGILIDMLFLKDEALLTQTIDDIARRGSLYAMVISPQNEQHKSVTVNILHGTPQEHRNMPLEDALKLLSRNFHDHIRMQRETMERERAERGPYIGVVSADREMQFLLRMLADGRWISLTEINLVIRYLQERRDKMQGDDRGPSRPIVAPGDVKLELPFKPKDEMDVSQKEQDLQNRIINLMNQGAPAANEPVSSAGLNQGLPGLDLPPSRQNQRSLSPMRPPMGLGAGMKSGRPGLDDNRPGPLGLDSDSPKDKDPFSAPKSKAPVSDSTTTPTYINFDNPSVKQALDNLIQSGPSLLKNISLSNSGSTNTPPNSASAGQSSNDSLKMGGSVDHLMNRGNMGPPRGSDIGGSMGPPRGSDIGGNMGPPRGSDIGGNMPRGPDMGGNMSRGSDLGGSMHRGPNLGGNMPRGSDMGGNMSRGPDMGGNMSSRNVGNLDMPRGSDLGDIDSMGPRGANKIPGMGGLDSGRGGFGNMSEMDHMNNPRGGFGNTGGGLSDMGRMGPLGGRMGLPSGGRMGPMGGGMGSDLGPLSGMGGGNFSGQNQYNKFPLGPGQQGNFPGSYNSGTGIGGMSRPGYGGPPLGMGGMGGPPRRY